MDRNVFWTALSRPLKRVALRKESVDRNARPLGATKNQNAVALRKESVDRNALFALLRNLLHVALRKESVDRNLWLLTSILTSRVALRKESVDRNSYVGVMGAAIARSLSARRAWIEIIIVYVKKRGRKRRSPQGERG